MKIRALTLLTLLGCVSPAFAETAGFLNIDKGRILNLEGTVQVREPGETAWKSPKKGTWLKPGAEIKTGAVSSCDIALGEGRNILQLKENSQTRLQTVSASAIRVDLAAGSVFARVRDLKKDSTFIVSSPTAIASVRGTGWEQSTEEISVFENAVEVAGSGGETLLVEEGFGVDIDPQGDLAAPEPVSDEDRAEYENFEAEAEQAVAEEASLPDDPGYEDAASGEEAPPAEAEAEGAEGEAGDFDSFGENFGSEGFENPADPGGEAGDEDILGEAKEEQQEADSESEGSEEDEPCNPNVYPYTC